MVFIPPPLAVVVDYEQALSGFMNKLKYTENENYCSRISMVDFRIW